ncbi:uncharacterized protein MONBRDRAFT_30194 [Monosiga brevicollis MX1]|uniref:Uncharacterized protein n=1 Tax=Monosiga brevicollis TaxID=81824 RepID=A9VD98_MONBE|nr:uncharacterized protein MONBRDRAFT_30194 [Monosiga brevicollis MX1]EDQ84491.1 predicted protein [Monosiga brevicollis MX1]|eukprot:XP_001750678.1 hypothetical protein [Monosiga brevicollis MX1]
MRRVARQHANPIALRFAGVLALIIAAIAFLTAFWTVITATNNKGTTVQTLAIGIVYGCQSNDATGSGSVATSCSPGQCKSHCAFSQVAAACLGLCVATTLIAQFQAGHRAKYDSLRVSRWQHLSHLSTLLAIAVAIVTWLQFHHAVQQNVGQYISLTNSSSSWTTATSASVSLSWSFWLLPGSGALCLLQYGWLCLTRWYATSEELFLATLREQAGIPREDVLEALQLRLRRDRKRKPPPYQSPSFLLLCRPPSYALASRLKGPLQARPADPAIYATIPPPLLPPAYIHDPRRRGIVSDRELQFRQGARDAISYQEEAQLLTRIIENEGRRAHQPAISPATTRSPAFSNHASQPTRNPSGPMMRGPPDARLPIASGRAPISRSGYAPSVLRHTAYRDCPAAPGSVPTSQSRERLARSTLATQRPTIRTPTTTPTWRLQLSQPHLTSTVPGPPIRHGPHGPTTAYPDHAPSAFFRAFEARTLPAFDPSMFGDEDSAGIDPDDLDALAHATHAAAHHEHHSTGLGERVSHIFQNIGRNLRGQTGYQALPTVDDTALSSDPACSPQPSVSYDSDFEDDEAEGPSSTNASHAIIPATRSGPPIPPINDDDGDDDEPMIDLSA